MIKLKVDKNKEVKDEGILYILYLWIDDVSVVTKIGVTSRKIEERVVEILTSYYHQHRMFPKLYPKRFRKTERVYEKEAMMHKYFENKQHQFEKMFSGSTEFFKDIDEEELLKVYEDCLNGADINADTYDYRNK